MLCFSFGGDTEKNAFHVDELLYTKTLTFKSYARTHAHTWTLARNSHFLPFLFFFADFGVFFFSKFTQKLEMVDEFYFWFFFFLINKFTSNHDGKTRDA